jgi:hypothetical protein
VNGSTIATLHRIAEGGTSSSPAKSSLRKSRGGRMTRTGRAGINRQSDMADTQHNDDDADVPAQGGVGHPTFTDSRPLAASQLVVPGGRKAWATSYRRPSQLKERVRCFGTFWP